LTYASPDSLQPALGFGLDLSDHSAEELLAGPCIAGCAGTTPHAVFGGLCPGAGFDGCDQVREALKEAVGAEVVDHVEERHLDAVGKGIVAGELGAGVGFEAFENGGQLCVDGRLSEFERAVGDL
jgi:hypothetical protein